jgi:hypothetical protein
MTAKELADLIGLCGDGGYNQDAATMLRQQQAEIEALKKRCLDEIFKTTYADRSAEVMCEQWEKAQAEIEALKKDLLKYDKLAWDDLTKAEIESGLSRVKWAELLIKQLPEEHEGRNSWLLNYGGDK